MEYFNIGALVSVVAFFLAFSQLIKPITDFRLGLGWLTLKRAGIFYSISIFLVFWAALLRYLSIKNPYFYFDSTFWQIFSGFIIVFVSGSLLYKSYARSKFTRRNCEKYFVGCYRIISKNHEQDIIDLVEEIRFGLDGLIDQVEKYKDRDPVPDVIDRALMSGRAVLNNASISEKTFKLA